MAVVEEVAVAVAVAARHLLGVDDEVVLDLRLRRRAVVVGDELALRVLGAAVVAPHPLLNVRRRRADEPLEPAVELRELAELELEGARACFERLRRERPRPALRQGDLSVAAHLH